MECSGKDDALNNSAKAIVNQVIAAPEASPTSTTYPNRSFQVPEVEPIQTVQQPIIPELVGTVQAQSIHQPYFDETSSTSQVIQYFVPWIAPGPSTNAETMFTDSEQFSPCLLQTPEVRPIQTMQKPIVTEFVGTVQPQIIHRPFFGETSSSSQNVQYFMPSIEPGPFTTVKRIFTDSEQFAPCLLQTPEVRPIQTMQKPIITEFMGTVRPQIIHRPFFGEASSSSQVVQYFMPSIEPGPSTNAETIFTDSEQFGQCLLQTPEFGPIQTMQKPIVTEFVGTVQPKIIHRPFFGEASSSSQASQYFVPSIEPGPFTTVETIFIDSEQFAQYVEELLDQQWEALSWEIKELTAPKNTTTMEKTTFFITVERDEVLYICELCNRTFHWVDHLIDHKEEIHGIFICQKCFKYFNKIGEYYDHLNFHRLYYYDIMCKICGKYFERIYLLIEHLQNHVNPKSYVCKLCRFSIKHKSHFLLHEIVHTDDKPFGCIRCKKTFKSERSAKGHFVGYCG